MNEFKTSAANANVFIIAAIAERLCALCPTARVTNEDLDKDSTFLITFAAKCGYLTFVLYRRNAVLVLKYSNSYILS